ncbi:MAG: RusA family crossover junction endodeoxyribonuclease [Alphaproteobacteria bacterium]|nr:RusA family crossover junction endodeoxyribonuclease [Alphaproteobacteria bacterium]MCW5739913.1 RusA family crossover junction endodeoxyribonuclease [Alphaproteobacteria bacterium]
MPDDEFPYPFELVLEGVPISLQASPGSRARWKGEVYRVGLERRQAIYDVGFLDYRALSLTIYYFPSAPMDGDVDNIVKPIMDGLIGVAYLNDNVIERVVVQKFEPNVDWDFSDPSDQLAAALDAVAPIVYIRVDDDLSWRRL